jgi:hypothetical protein
MPKLYELNVTFTQDQEIAKWEFSSEGRTEAKSDGEEQCCHVHVDDQVHFSFNGPGDLASALVLCGQMQDGLPSSPFKEGNNIDLKKGSTLTVADEIGVWGFSIAFTARNGDATTSFYYVPDPEMEVKNRPGSDD